VTSSRFYETVSAVNYEQKNNLLDGNLSVESLVRFLNLENRVVKQLAKMLAILTYLQESNVANNTGFQDNRKYFHRKLVQFVDHNVEPNSF
jgi:hypothetical protein